MKLFTFTHSRENEKSVKEQDEKKIVLITQVFPASYISIAIVWYFFILASWQVDIRRALNAVMWWWLFICQKTKDVMGCDL